MVLFALLGVLSCWIVYQAHWAQPQDSWTSAWKATNMPSSTPKVRLAVLFTPEVRYWEERILAWSQAYDLDPNLVATVMQIESCGYPQAESWAGAKGLFQVMPYHFQPGENPFDPETNARRGLAYLRRVWERSQGDVRLTLAAYNGGMKRLQEPESAWPRETQRYVRWGYAIYQDAQAGRTSSPALQEWLEAGGWWLCQKARLSLPLD